MRKFAFFFILFFPCVCLLAEENDNDLITLRSEFNVLQTVKRIKHQARKQGLSLPLSINYSSKAKKAGITLPPTEGVFISENTIISKLIASNPKAALMFPPEVIVYEDKNGKALICYFDPMLYGKWFHLEDQEDTLKELSWTFSELLRKAAHP